MWLKYYLGISTTKSTLLYGGTGMPLISGIDTMAGSRSFINPGSLVLFLHRHGHLRPYSAS